MYNRKTVVTITPPTVLAVSLADMKAYLVISDSADDALITAFIEASTDAIKRYLRRGIAVETVELQLDGFPGYDDDALFRLGPGVHTGHYDSFVSRGDEIDLPYAPVASITSVTTYDRDNVAAVFTSAAYFADLASGRLILNEGYSWPSNIRRRDAIRVRYIIGSATVPPAISTGIKQHVAVMYECRDACELPDGCKAILAGYRRFDDMGFI